MARQKVTGHIVDDEPINVWHPSKDSPFFSISYGYGGWMPGSYDSVESALLGARACFQDEWRFVIDMQQPINHMDKQDRLITVDDFKGWFKQ